MGSLFSLFSSKKTEESLTNQGTVNNNVIVEESGTKIGFIEALLIVFLILKFIEVILLLMKSFNLKCKKFSDTESNNNVP